MKGPLTWTQTPTMLVDPSSFASAVEPPYVASTSSYRRGLPREPTAVCSTPDATPDKLCSPTGDVQMWLSAAVYVVDTSTTSPIAYTTKVAPKGTILLELCHRL